MIVGIRVADREELVNCDRIIVKFSFNANPTVVELFRRNVGRARYALCIEPRVFNRWLSPVTTPKEDLLHFRRPNGSCHSVLNSPLLSAENALDASRICTWNLDYLHGPTSNLAIQIMFIEM